LPIASSSCTVERATNSSRFRAPAAADGVAPGQRLLADLYLAGLGVPLDEGKAIALYQQAAAQGDLVATAALEEVEKRRGLPQGSLLPKRK
jgi:TPR repeat protein